MNSLQYSKEALEAKSLFYNKHLSVYVEGEDDVLFWQYLFNAAEISAHVEDVGGVKEIEKYIVKILEEDAGFIVACDNDYNDFLELPPAHPNIIRTYGYSIENSMYYFNKIHEIVTKLCRQKIDVQKIIEKWAEDFTNNVYDLLRYDIANFKFSKGIKVIGNNCFRFLQSDTSPYISQKKISDFLDSIRGHFSEGEIKIVDDLISVSKKDFWFLIKGHFLTHATINLIKTLVKKHSGSVCSLSKDAIYALTIDCTENWEERIDILTVINTIRKVSIA